MAQAQMKVGRFELSIQARDPIILPPYKGSTLRGGFGNAFKRVVCALKEKECADCILKEKHVRKATTFGLGRYELRLQ